MLCCAGDPVLLWGWFPWHQSVPAGGIDVWALSAGPCHHHWQTQVGVVLITWFYIMEFQLPLHNWSLFSLQYNTSGTWLWCKYYCVWRYKDPGWPLTFKLWPLGYLHYGNISLLSQITLIWLIKMTPWCKLFCTGWTRGFEADWNWTGHNPALDFLPSIHEHSGANGKVCTCICHLWGKVPQVANTKVRRYTYKVYSEFLNGFSPLAFFSRVLQRTAISTNIKV